MQFVKRTWNRMICTIIVLATMLWMLTVYVAWQNGSIKGYELGRMRADIESPFKGRVEAGQPFCYDSGVIYPVRKGKKSFIPDFQ